MKIKDEKVSSLIINISAWLIPISLTSITLVGVQDLEGFVKNLMMFTIPAQIILLIASLWISINLYHEKAKNIETHLKYGRLTFFLALLLIAANHLILLLSQ